MVLVDAGALVSAGLVVGAIAAWYLSAASQAFLFRLQATDPRAFAGGWCPWCRSIGSDRDPARWAASVDPMIALRVE